MGSGFCLGLDSGVPMVFKLKLWRSSKEVGLGGVRGDHCGQRASGVRSGLSLLNLQIRS